MARRKKSSSDSGNVVIAAIVGVVVFVVWLWQTAPLLVVAAAACLLGGIIWWRSRREAAPSSSAAPRTAVEAVRSRRTGGRRSGPAPTIAPDQVAALPPRPAAWPTLPEMPTMTGTPYVAVADREYARTDCPHCRAALEPLPKAKKRCPSCSEEIFVRSGPDNRRYLLRQDELETMEQAWAERSAAEWEQRRQGMTVAEEAWWRTVGAAGIFGGDGECLDVVGESFHLAELVALTQRYPDGQVVALLQREPTNPYDRNAIEVRVDGVAVGHLSREDAEEYQPILRSYERAKRRLFVVASLQGGRLEDDGRYGPVGVVLERVPEA